MTMGMTVGMSMYMTVRCVCSCCEQTIGSESAEANTFGVLLTGSTRFGICPVCLSGVHETLMTDKKWQRRWTNFYLKEVMKRRLAAAR